MTLLLPKRFDLSRSQFLVWSAILKEWNALDNHSWCRRGRILASILSLQARKLVLGQGHSKDVVLEVRACLAPARVR